MKVYKFTVAGSGYFPADMLRYDCCYPADPGSVVRLGSSDHHEIRRVTLISHVHPPTEGRWKSFGWPVETQEVEKRI